MKRALLGLAALVAVTFIIFGWPWLLWRATAGPLADYLPDLSNLSFALTHPDASGMLLVLVLTAAGAAWVVTASVLVVELLTQARGVAAPRLTGLAFGALVPQTSMSRLAAAALFILPVSATIAGPASAAALSPAAPAVAAVSSQETCRSDARSGVESHTVRPGDTLWSVADDKLGDGARYPDVFRASKGLAQPDGSRLRDPDVIRPGWRLNIPQSVDRSAQSCPQRTPATTTPRNAEQAPERSAADGVSPSSSSTRPQSDAESTAKPQRLDRGPGLRNKATPAQPSPPEHKMVQPGADSAAPAELPKPAVRLAAVGSDRAELTWSQVPGASSYWVVVGEQSMRVPGTAIALRGLAADTDYRVEVRAMFPSGDWSKPTVLKVQTAPEPATSSRAAARHASLRALRHPDNRSAPMAMPHLTVPKSASPATRCLTQMQVALGISEDLAPRVEQRPEPVQMASARARNGMGGLHRQRLSDHATALAELCPPHMQRADLIDRATVMSSFWLPGTAAANMIRSGVTSVHT